MATVPMLFFLWALIQGMNGEAWNITLPLRIMGVEGSCMAVPCSVVVPPSYSAQLNNCSGGGVWRRNDAVSPNIKSADVLVLGDLRKKNCTTVFRNFTKKQNNMYFFRIECPDLKYTFKQGVRITVTSGVAPPSLTSVSHVTEGGHVSLQCSAMAPCPFLPPSFIWAAPQSNRKEQTQVLKNSDGQMILKSTLTFTASAQHHNKTVTCSVSYPLSAGGSSEAFTTSHALNVLYGPMNTAADVSVPGPVPEGSVVVFTCSTDANPPVSSYTWFSNTNGTMVKVGEEPTLPLQVKPAHSGLYECQAQNERGVQRSKPLLLEVTAQNGVCCSVGFWVSVGCGVLSALCVLSVALLFYKYRSVSKRLKHMEQRENNIYCDLQTSCVSSDYDKLQAPQPKVKTPPEMLEYENTAALREGFNQNTGGASE
ncbi:sialoadhesin [Periophthalmus magnuspinnatus]|uniref:sialoadhesin n=1 Tax=Periophthalmus magnuspinnatus TaxID=409849 RepID=UPI0024367DE9|nr:sialoadhesin [Periophthalmus magnuspinnatus]